MKIDPADIQFTAGQSEPPLDQLDAMHKLKQVAEDPLGGLFSIHRISIEQAKALFELGLLNERELDFVKKRD